MKLDYENYIQREDDTDRYKNDHCVVAVPQWKIPLPYYVDDYLTMGYTEVSTICLYVPNIKWNEYE